MTDPKPTIDPREVRSSRARGLLNDPLLSEILAGMTKRATDDWIGSPADKPEVREAAWHRVRAVHAVTAEIESVALDNQVRGFNAKDKK